MNEAASVRRRLAIEAMGLGPLWTVRESREEAATHDVVHDLDARAAAIASMSLDALDAAVIACRACTLGVSRTQAVPGSGAAHPHWMVVGAAPSADDDATGEAMTGRAGRLLDAMLNAVGLARRESVFVTTSVKCRPPDDRSATATEIACCKPFLDRQITLLAPRLVLAVGGAVDANGVPSIATLHPAELLERPAAKAEAWADLCRARELA